MSKLKETKKGRKPVNFLKRKNKQLAIFILLSAGKSCSTISAELSINQSWVLREVISNLKKLKLIHCQNQTQKYNKKIYDINFDSLWELFNNFCLNYELLFDYEGITFKEVYTIIQNRDETLQYFTSETKRELIKEYDELMILHEKLKKSNSLYVFELIKNIFNAQNINKYFELDVFSNISFNDFFFGVLHSIMSLNNKFKNPASKSYIDLEFKMKNDFKELKEDIVSEISKMKECNLSEFLYVVNDPFIDSLRAYFHKINSLACSIKNLKIHPLIRDAIEEVSGYKLLEEYSRTARNNWFYSEAFIKNYNLVHKNLFSNSKSKMSQQVLKENYINKPSVPERFHKFLKSQKTNR